MSSKLVQLSVAILCIVAVVYADFMALSPMGSNNRLNEANRARNNANRLFDSQNNNRGGYNVGSVYFYTGSTVYMEWTGQHSCGNPNNNCEVIVQYGCDDLLRDGTTTNTIPDVGQNEYTAGVDANPKFGRHESFQSYQTCKYTSRNKGLFTSNQNLQGQTAVYTRQNPNGGANDRHGYECPEERDYYPYWRPTMWRDVAVLTNQPSRCAAYQANSQNVQDRSYCIPPPEGYKNYVSKNPNGGAYIPITKEACEALSYTSNNVTTKGVWATQPAWGLAAPDCRESPWQRDNHHGNIAGGFTNQYNWTIPTGLNVSERCSLRFRYNISTEDFPGFSSPTSVTSGVNSNNSYLNNPTANRDPANVDVWSKYGLTRSDVAASLSRTTNDPNSATIKNSRDYVLKNNPKVDIFGNTLVPRGGDTTQPNMIRLQLATNTNQFGRTFQDRTHRIAFRNPPAELKGATIHNIQVSGKRGNIVQVYPATEYNFNPRRLSVQTNSYVHFQWTGSNTNPDNNAGQGKAGTDRSNVVLLRNKYFEEGQKVTTTPPTYGSAGTNYPANVKNTTFLGFSYDDVARLATTSYGLAPNGQFGGNMDELNDAGTYFDLGPRKVTTTGIFNYVSTRNNNFSNRDQKGRIIVSDFATNYVAAGQNGGRATTDTGDSLVVSPGALASLTTFTLVSYPSSTQSSLSGGVASNYLALSPLVLPLAPGGTVTLNINYNVDHFGSATMYRADDIMGDWSKQSASFSSGTGSTDTTQGGVYVVQTKTNWGAVAGVIIAVLVVIAAVIFFLYRRYRKTNTNSSTRV